MLEFLICLCYVTALLLHNTAWIRSHINIGNHPKATVRSTGICNDLMILHVQHIAQKPVFIDLIIAILA